MSRSRGYNRDISWRKALCKRRISREICSDRFSVNEYYDNLHQYSKNKIHCSCPLCSTKTRNKGRRKRGNYSPSIYWKKSDLIQQIDMNEQEKELAQE